METIGSKRSYALIWCMPNNDDDDERISGSIGESLGTAQSWAGSFMVGVGG